MNDEDEQEEEEEKGEEIGDGEENENEDELPLVYNKRQLRVVTCSSSFRFIREEERLNLDEGLR